MIFALAGRERTGFEAIRPIAETVFHKIQDFARHDSHALTGLSTGYRDLDNITSGLQAGDLIIVAARPSMGKTALCLNIAQRAAIREKAVVAVFSLEMSKEQLVMRMMSAEASVDARNLRLGILSKNDWGRLAEGIADLSETKLFIDDTPGISVIEMRAKLRRLAVEQKRIDLVVVDYLQLMSSSGRRNENRQQEVSESKDLKALPGIQLPGGPFQLSRAPEAKPAKPMMSDLRESGRSSRTPMWLHLSTARTTIRRIGRVPEEAKHRRTTAQNSETARRILSKWPSSSSPALRMPVALKVYG